MATIVNKRQHQLRDGAVLLLPGENTVDNEVWNKTKVAGSQLELWLKLNWIAQKRALPVAPADLVPVSAPAAPPASAPPAESAVESGMDAAAAPAALEEPDLKRGRRK